MIFRIALRYLLAKKSHKVVNVISGISIAGVAVATAAIVVVLSVFNGFSQLATSHLSMIDPDVKAVPVGAKAFAGADSLARVLEALPEVAVAAPVLQERALLAGDNTQMPVVVKGVDPARFPEMVDTDELLIDGIYSDVNGLPDSVAGIQLAVSVAVNTGMRPSPLRCGDLYMPRRTGRINPANPSAAYRSIPVAVTGVFRVDQSEYDNEYVLAPLQQVRQLLEYDRGEASAIEVKGAAGVEPEALVKAVSSVLGDGFEVLDRVRQQADTFRMIAVEKWVTFLMLVFILIIAAFNIVSTLSLMVIEKRDNMATLRMLGSTRRDVRSIFVVEGWLITAAGGVAGVIAGAALVLIQEHFGLIRLSGDPSTLSIDVYPVALQWGDLLATAGTVAVTGLIIGAVSTFFTRKIS